MLFLWSKFNYEKVMVVCSKKKIKKAKSSLCFELIEYVLWKLQQVKVEVLFNLM